MHHEEPVAELLRASWKLPPRLTPALMIRLPAIASFPPLKIRELSSFSYSYSCHLFIVCLTRFLLIIPMRSYPHLPSRNGREDFVVFACAQDGFIISSAAPKRKLHRYQSITTPPGLFGLPGCTAAMPSVMLSDFRYVSIWDTLVIVVSKVTVIV